MKGPAAIVVDGVAESAETEEGAGHGKLRDGKSESFALQVGVEPSASIVDEFGRAEVCQYCGLLPLPPLPPLPLFFLTWRDFWLLSVLEGTWQTV